MSIECSLISPLRDVFFRPSATHHASLALGAFAGRMMIMQVSCAATSFPPVRARWWENLPSLASWAYRDYREAVRLKLP